MPTITCLSQEELKRLASRICSRDKRALDAFQAFYLSIVEITNETDMTRREQIANRALNQVREAIQD